MIYSKILPEVLIPAVSGFKKKGEARGFGVILEDGSKISIEGVAKIKRKTSLSPLFFITGRGFCLDISRRYARHLDGGLVFLRRFADTERLFSELSFSLSETLLGAFASFFSCVF